MPMSLLNFLLFFLTINLNQSCVPASNPDGESLIGNNYDDVALKLSGQNSDLRIPPPMDLTAAKTLSSFSLAPGPGLAKAMKDKRSKSYNNVLDNIPTSDITKTQKDSGFYNDQNGQFWRKRDDGKYVATNNFRQQQSDGSWRVSSKTYDYATRKWNDADRYTSMQLVKGKKGDGVWVARGFEKQGDKPIPIGKNLPNQQDSFLFYNADNEKGRWVAAVPSQLGRTQDRAEYDALINNSIEQSVANGRDDKISSLLTKGGYFTMDLDDSGKINEIAAYDESLQPIAKDSKPVVITSNSKLNDLKYAEVIRGFMDALGNNNQ